MDAGHLKEAEEDNFIQQTEKILLMATKDRNKPGDQPQDTKPGKTDAQLTTIEGGGTTTAKTSPPIAAKMATKSSTSTPTAASTEGGGRSETGGASISMTSITTASTAANGRRNVKVISEVTGEPLPYLPLDSVPFQTPLRPDPDKSSKTAATVVSNISHHPLTRDVATGMSPAMSSIAVLGSQSSGEDGSRGKRVNDPSPPLSTQTSNEVYIVTYGTLCVL